MSWWQALIVAVVLAAGLYALTAWNLIAWQRERLRERQAAALLAGDHEQAMAITRDEQEEAP